MNFDLVAERMDDMRLKCEIAAETKIHKMVASAQPLPVGVLRSRQLNTQKPPVREQNVTPAEVLPNGH